MGVWETCTPSPTPRPAASRNAAFLFRVMLASQHRALGFADLRFPVAGRVGLTVGLGHALDEVIEIVRAHEDAPPYSHTGEVVAHAVDGHAASYPPPDSRGCGLVREPFGHLG